jgi:hypothetical protein
MLDADLSLLLGTSSAREKGFLRVFSTNGGAAKSPAPARWSVARDACGWRVEAACVFRDAQAGKDADAGGG